MKTVRELSGAAAFLLLVALVLVGGMTGGPGRKKRLAYIRRS
jgi:hypothetical protein